MSETEQETTEDSGFYCPGCGARYTAQGTCENGHEPIETKPLSEVVAAPDTGETASESVDGGSETVEAPLPSAPAPETVSEPTEGNVVAEAVAAFEQHFADFKNKLGL